MSKYLMVVDMQKDFVTGSLGTEEAKAVIPAIRSKVNDQHQVGHAVIFTRDTHGENYLDTQEGKMLPVPHCISGTDGHEIIPELSSIMFHHSDIVLDKKIFGAEPFYLLDCLYEIGFKEGDEMELCGVCTDICVISNAVIVRTLYPESKITVDSKAVAGVTPEKNAAALEVLRSLQVNVI